MPDSIHAGELLAGRYRLDELLAESAGGRFWRATDTVLDRYVAVHLIARTEERAEGLLAAARRTAPHHDRRLLRVLDADQADGLYYVVNEWGQGTSLDIMLANTGPLMPRRAAWIVSEVADSLAGAHEAGLDHGRMVPENVLIDLNGQVRIIGFGVDAALRGLPPGRHSADLIDTVAVLYAALTGKWAGVSTSNVAAAPTSHGQVMRPRQVRAGIPRPLDALCDQVINQNSSHAQRTPHDLTTLAGVATMLSDFVGDPTGIATAASWRQHQVGADVSLQGSPSTAEPAPSLQVSPTPDVETPVEPVPESRTEPTPEPPTSPAPRIEPLGESVEMPTQAGIPVFGEQDDVGWIAARSQAPAPPPPFGEKPPKPLFAPAPAEGEPVRRPRPGVVAAPSRDYWPWDSTGHTGTGAVTNTSSGVWPEPEQASDDGVPGRRWFQLAMMIGVGVLILVAAVSAFHLGSDDGETQDAPSSSQQPAAEPVALTGITATDFDPQGSEPREENPQLVDLVLDGDPETSWHTASYKQNFGPGGLKDGVGLILDLGTTKGVREVEIATLDGPTAASVFVTNDPPVGVADLTPVGSAADNGTLSISLDEAVSGRYVTVWLTSLPLVGSDYRGTIADVVVKG